VGAAASAGVGIAHDVQPMPRPALGEGIRIQKGVDDSFQRIRRFIGEEGVLLGDGWREPGQGESDPAQESFASRIRGGFERPRLQPGKHEVIDVRPRPCLVSDNRDWVFGDRLKAPELTSGFNVDVGPDYRRGRGRQSNGGQC